MVGEITRWLAQHGGPNGPAWFDALALLGDVGLVLFSLWAVRQLIRSWAWLWRPPSAPNEISVRYRRPRRPGRR